MLKNYSVDEKFYYVGTFIGYFSKERQRILINWEKSSN